MSTYLFPPTDLSLPTFIYHFSYSSFYIYIYVYPFKPTNLYLPTYIYLPTHVNLPSSTYLPLPIPKYHYIIAADQGAGIGFNLWNYNNTTKKELEAIWNAISVLITPNC